MLKRSRRDIYGTLYILYIGIVILSSVLLFHACEWLRATAAYSYCQRSKTELRTDVANHTPTIPPTSQFTIDTNRASF